MAAEAHGSKRLLELDALRGIAAIGVVLYHYFFRYDVLFQHVGIASAWARGGKLGVELFFMVSGYVIFWTVTRSQRPLDFIVSRFSRLYPVYWFAVVVSYFVVSCFGLPGREVQPSQAALNLLMFQEYLGVAPVDGVYWTLTVELTFYVWIFLLYIAGLLAHIEKLMAAFVLVSIANSLGLVVVPALLQKVFLLQFVPFFLAGICFYKLSTGQRSKSVVSIGLLCLLSTIVIYSPARFLVFALFFLVFFLAVTGRLKVLSAKPLVFLGSISYSLYLLHQNIGYVIIQAFYRMHWHPLLGILLAIALSLALAAFSTKYVEKPALAWIRKYYQRTKAIPVRASVEG